MIVLDTNVLVGLDLYALDPDELYAASIVSRAELELGAELHALLLTPPPARAG